jgi:hypothetical protein
MSFILNRWAVLEYWLRATHVFENSCFIAVTEADVVVKIWYDTNSLCWRGQSVN